MDLYFTFSTWNIHNVTREKVRVLLSWFTCKACVWREDLVFEYSIFLNIEHRGVEYNFGDHFWRQTLKAKIPSFKKLIRYGNVHHFLNVCIHRLMIGMRLPVYTMPFNSYISKYILRSIDEKMMERIT